MLAWLRRITGGLDAEHEGTEGASGTTAASLVRGVTESDASVPAMRIAEAESGRFEERGTVASGGMAHIDRVLDRRIGREVAVKRLHEPDASRRMKVLEEAQITGQLEHPNVVPIHDIFGDGEGRPDSFLMKLIEGRTLQALIRECPADRGPNQRELETLLQVFLKVCDGVSFAHSRGVIHRDIKPENVMVGGFGQVYVMDWGLAKVVEGEAHDRAERPSRVRASHARAERRGETYGTPAYMAIEQAFGDVDSIDERTDVYQLGGVLYEMLTQRAPHENAASVIKGQPPHPQAVVGERPLPARLCEIAMKALEADQNDRYQSVDALRQDVEGFIRSGGWFPSRKFAAGEIIIREGDEGRTAYLIESGTCEVSREAGGRRERVRELGPGEPFGEAALFSDKPRTATVSALTDVKLTVIDRESLDRELERHTWLRSLVSAMGLRFVEVDRELKDRRRAESSARPASGDG
jgi:serine/threonine-protein kinase